MIPCLLRTPLALVAIGLCMPCMTVRAQSADPPASIVPAAPLVDVPAGIDLLEQGDELRITRRDARETFGILQSVSSSSLTIATENGSQEVPLDLVRRVKRRGDRLWDGLVIGAAFGAIVSAATFVPCGSYSSWGTCDDNFTTSRAGDALAGAAVFGLIGLGIDAAHRGWSTVYRRPSGLPTAFGLNTAARETTARETTAGALPEGVIVTRRE